MNKMTLPEALDAVKALVAKGWSFTFDVGLRFRGGGHDPSWSVRAVGAGLANAWCGGETLEDAISHVLSYAQAMEDDPAIVIAKHETWITENIREIFGMDSFRGIKAEPDEYNGGQHRIIVSVVCADPKVFVDRESVFYERLFHKPDEIRHSLMVEPVFPEDMPEHSDSKAHNSELG